MKRGILVCVGGLLFGAGLAVSGMTDPARVIGFLDVTGAWDPTLLFVMGGAVVTFGAAYWTTRYARGGAGWFGSRLPGRNVDPVDRRLVAGTVLFGVGWGLAGFCPGPALANLAAVRGEAVVFVAAMAVGMFAARRWSGADAD